jgi:hypothetical protein
MKKKEYIVPEAQIISLRQTSSLLVTSGDIYNGGANAPDLLDMVDIEESLNNELDSYFVFDRWYE